MPMRESDVSTRAAGHRGKVAFAAVTLLAALAFAASPPADGSQQATWPAAEAIDSMLAADPPAALAACRAIDAGPDATPRDRGRFLQQYGLALAATGDRRGATLTLVRGALLDGDSRWAARSALLAAESARIGWKDSPDGPALVGSLTRLALDLAEASGDDETRRAAAAALGRRTP
jgi:hypothetical protein